jgi:hypothetical protein
MHNHSSQNTTLAFPYLTSSVAIRYVDSTGHIHLEETGLALIPGVDQYEVVK